MDDDVAAEADDELRAVELDTHDGLFHALVGGDGMRTSIGKRAGSAERLRWRGSVWAVQGNEQSDQGHVRHFGRLYSQLETRFLPVAASA